MRDWEYPRKAGKRPLKILKTRTREVLGTQIVLNSSNAWVFTMA
jgi:hypothetical protein